MAAESALTKRPPTEVERFLIHDLYLEYSKYDDPQRKVKKPDNVEWMADTKMSAIQIMQPQDRNIHDKVKKKHRSDRMDLRRAKPIKRCSISHTAL